MARLTIRYLGPGDLPGRAIRADFHGIAASIRALPEITRPAVMRAAHVVIRLAGVEAVRSRAAAMRGRIIQGVIGPATLRIIAPPIRLTVLQTQVAVLPDLDVFIA